jgi:Kef-type K+ transport system membrane component KefB
VHWVSPTLPAVVCGAALTATSVGITARVLSDLGRLQEPESQVVLGAAVIDDIIGLIILAVVTGIMAGGS